jgi:Kef-type K+ transport system membrane component KefB
MLGAQDVSLWLVIGKKVIFFVSIFLIGWKLVPLVMRWLAPLKVTEAVISAALILCFSFAFYSETMGIAGIIGAFAAGVAIAQTNYKEEVIHKLEPIAYGVFVPVFFVSIGLSVTFSGIADQFWFIVILSLIAIVTKLVGCGLGAKLTGFSTHSALGIGAGMISRGEVALIIAAIGLESQLLKPEYFTSTIIVVIVTTLVTPPLLKVLFKEKAERPS